MLSTEDKEFIAAASASASAPAKDDLPGIPGGRAGALLALGILAFLAREFYTSLDEDRTALFAKTTTFQSDLNVTQTKLSSLEAISENTLKSLETLKTVTADGDLMRRGLASEISNNSEEITELKTKMGDRYTAKDAAQDRQSEERNNEILQRQIDDQQASLNSVRSTINTLEEAVQGLRLRMTYEVGEAPK